MRRVIAPVLIVVVGFVFAGVLLGTGPKVEPRAPEVISPLVRVLDIVPRTVRFRVSTHGTVVPRTESDLVPEVSGRVTWISPALVSGGFFSKDEPLLRIDPLDYDVALEESRAGLARAESDLDNAKTDHQRQLDLVQRRVASDVQRDNAANRLRIAEAVLREAQARLARADRDRARTETVAPYDGRVRSERVDVGQFVARGAAIGTIYAVDYAEVRLPVPDEELAYLDLPMSRGAAENVAPVPVILRARFAGGDHEWLGEVVRTEGELDPKSRMVNVIARVKDPYLQPDGRPPLSVGLFVQAEILGATADDVVVLPRSAVRRGDSVLIVDADSRLRFREIDVLRTARDEVFVRAGLAAGERICVSPLEAATEGMRVRIGDDTPSSSLSAPLAAPSAEPEPNT
jgi:RND family efflux transporter MFP subunit